MKEDRIECWWAKREEKKDNFAHIIHAVYGERGSVKASYHDIYLSYCEKRIRINPDKNLKYNLGTLEKALKEGAIICPACKTEKKEKKNRYLFDKKFG